MKKIFIIEDDEVLRAELSRILEFEGYSTEECMDFAHADHLALASQPDVIIVDLSLPENDGLSICRAVRTKSAVPILVLTSSDEEFDEVMSLKLGADDYLTKPYSPVVLLAHIGRLLERGGQGVEAHIRWQGLELDISHSEVTFDKRSVELSRNEMRILAALMRAEGRIVSRQDLMYEIWQSDEFIDDNTLTVNVNRLRHELERVGAPEDLLKTHRGQGYSL